MSHRPTCGHPQQHHPCRRATSSGPKHLEDLGVQVDVATSSMPRIPAARPAMSARVWWAARYPDVFGCLLSISAGTCSEMGQRRTSPAREGRGCRQCGQPACRCSGAVCPLSKCALTVGPPQKRLYWVLSEIFDGDASDDPRLEESADIMAALAQQGCTSREINHGDVAHNDLPFDLLDAFAVESDPRAQRPLDLMRKRGWASWTRIRPERLAERPTNLDSGQVIVLRFAPRWVVRVARRLSGVGSGSVSAGCRARGWAGRGRRCRRR